MDEGRKGRGEKEDQRGKEGGRKEWKREGGMEGEEKSKGGRKEGKMEAGKRKSKREKKGRGGERRGGEGKEGEEKEVSDYFFQDTWQKLNEQTHILKGDKDIPQKTP